MKFQYLRPQHWNIPKTIFNKISNIPFMPFAIFINYPQRCRAFFRVFIKVHE